jgi:drug/metabolite transporter (DMT)-like permease
MNNTGVYIKLLLTTFFWAAVFHIGKYLVALVSPLYAGAWRFVLAAAILVPLIAVREGWSFSSLRSNAFGLSVMSIVGVFGFNACLFYGLQHTSAVNGALIMGFNPALTVLMSALINRDPITRKQVIGLLLGIIGVVFVVSKGSWHTLASMSFSSGDLLILLASLCWAIYPVIPKRFVKGMSTLQITGSTIAGGAAVMALFASAATPNFYAIPSVPVAAGIVFMGVFGSVLAYLWWNQGVQKLGAAPIAIFINTVPVFTALIGVALGQTITTAQLYGAALVIGGVLYSSGKLDFLTTAWSKVWLKWNESVFANRS